MNNQNTIELGVIVNGVTGRMGTHQHLRRSLIAIQRQGGVPLPDGRRVTLRLLLVGRSPEKLAALATEAGEETQWTTDLDSALADRRYSVYFDAQTTDRRAAALRRAISAHKHVYAEKPVAMTTTEAIELWRAAETAGLCNGVVQDKLWLPGLRKMRRLVDSGYFGRLLSVRGEFGYWVFDGHDVPPQRPSWNYRREDGGGIILDMFAHWRYVLDRIFAPVRAVCCLGATHLPERWDERGQRYACTAEDAAYAMFELDGGVIATINASWCVRVRRDDLLTLQADGTAGSAVAGLRRCWIQPAAGTPRPVWNPDVDQPLNFFDSWLEVPDQETYDNAFKAQWEAFLAHVVTGSPFPWTLLEGAKGVQLAELAHRSWRERRWIDVPKLGAEEPAQ
ncbi:MAG: Gfo/Idh/MocA family oxidoreductase [Kiritimatiellae bacterium]|nr:Gfo/Idh/MocA family oxidoreductase [Kiritimatiellia bacterium]